MKILSGGLGPFCLLFCLTSVDAAFAIPVAPLGNLRGANDQLITQPDRPAFASDLRRTSPRLRPLAQYTRRDGPQPLGAALLWLSAASLSERPQPAGKLHRSFAGPRPALRHA